MSQSQSGPQPQYTPRGPVSPGTSPQAQSASAPMWNPPAPPRGDPMKDFRPQPQGMSVPMPQPRPQPNFQGRPQRSVTERHEAFLHASEALHDRHYEDNSIRLEAELRLAEFFLS